MKLLAITSLFALSSLLGGCNRPSAETERVVQIADPQVGTLREELGDLKRKHDRLESELDSVRKLALATGDDLESLRKTVNQNAAVMNGNALRRMTADGVCGQETYYDSSNIARLRNRTCTDADFRRDR